MKAIVGLLVLALLTACGADGEPVPPGGDEVKLSLLPNGKPLLGVTRAF
ncbi:hypothetical protein [Thalassovita sp.]|nr:hypothetical protein [Thalassovita sp.]